MTEESNFQLDKSTPYRTKGRQPKEVTINVLLFAAGLGDNIHRLPAIQYILNNHSHVKLRLWSLAYFIEILNNLFEFDSRVSIKHHDDPDKHLYISKPGAVVVHPWVGVMSERHTTFRTHLTKHAFYRVANTEVLQNDYYNLPELSLRNIDLTKFDLPKDYVVITPSFTSGTRVWPQEEINKTISYMNTKKIKVVFLGKELVVANKHFQMYSKTQLGIKIKKGIDLLDQTTLLQAAKIMKGSRAVMGVDNGLLHLACMTGSNTKVIGGFTTVDPRLRMPYREGRLGFNFDAVTPEVGCRYCQSRMNFIYDHDFMNCFYEEDDRAETGTQEKIIYKCLKQMKAEKFIEAFKRINS